VIRPGEVQRMSAGNGVRHSELNHSQTEPVHFLQIWLLPNRTGLAAGYAQQAFPPAVLRGRLCLLVSPDGREGSLPAHQDASLYATLLTAGERLDHPLPFGARAYVQVARGGVEVNDVRLGSGDGVALSDTPEVRIRGLDAAEVLLFELP
jgi:redox-sensitive bicupin YhaK (pirin superfamily)